MVHRRRRAVATLAAILVGAVLLATRHSAGAKETRTDARSSSTTGAALAGATALDPSGFSPGACESFPPTEGNRHLTVFLDAGHGGIDPGGVGTTESGATVYEADETLQVELDTMAILRGAGFRVVVSRTGNTSVTRLTSGDVSEGALTIQGAHDDVAARDVCANVAHADILIGIYFDAGSSSANAGCVTGYDTVRPFAAQNLRLATLVQTDVLDAMNAQGWEIPDEGVMTDDNLGSAQSDAAIAYGHLMLLGPAETGYFSTPSQMPGALIEPLFITDPFEASIASSTHGQQVMAGGLAQAVEGYFAPVAPSSTPSSTPSSRAATPTRSGGGAT